MTAPGEGVPHRLPLLLDLRGASALVVGGGTVATGKVASLLDAGAAVTLVAPQISDELRATVAGGRIVWHDRRYEAADLDRVLLVVAATDDAEVNARVAGDAAAAGTVCVRADGGGIASFAGAVRHGPLTIAVSTDGAAPALARRLRGEIAATYGPEYGILASLLGELRVDPTVHALLDGVPAAERGARWRSVLDTDILTHIRAGRVDRAKEVAISCLSSSSD